MQIWGEMQTDLLGDTWPVLSSRLFILPRILFTVAVTDDINDSISTVESLFAVLAFSGSMPSLFVAFTSTVFLSHVSIWHASTDPFKLSDTSEAQSSELSTFVANWPASLESSLLWSVLPSRPFFGKIEPVISSFSLSLTLRLFFFCFDWKC